MPNMQEAKRKVAAAEKACARVQSEWSAAYEALGGSVGTNGYGIYRERFELRDKLELARQHINQALTTMDSIDWPTNADYDVL